MITIFNIIIYIFFLVFIFFFNYNASLIHLHLILHNLKFFNIVLTQFVKKYSLKYLMWFKFRISINNYLIFFFWKPKFNRLLFND